MFYKMMILVGLMLSLVACGQGGSDTPVVPPGEESPAGEGAYEEEEEVGVEEPEGEQPLLTFVDDILPIIQVRCTLCHAENSGLVYLEDFDTLVDNQQKVRNRVFVVRNMPQNNATGMTDQERQRVADWIDQGALEQ